MRCGRNLGLVLRVRIGFWSDISSVARDDSGSLFWDGIEKMDSTQTDYVQKLWDGDVRLVVTYWGFGVLAVIPQYIFLVLMGMLGNSGSTVGILLILVYNIMMTRAIYLSAGNFEGWRVWKFMARIHAIFVLVANFSYVLFGQNAA